MWKSEDVMKLILLRKVDILDCNNVRLSPSFLSGIVLQAQDQVQGDLIQNISLGCDRGMEFKLVHHSLI